MMAWGSLFFLELGGNEHAPTICSLLHECSFSLFRSSGLRSFFVRGMCGVVGPCHLGMYVAK
jgi:hypothetical protein